MPPTTAIPILFRARDPAPSVKAKGKIAATTALKGWRIKYQANLHTSSISISIQYSI